MTAPLSDKPVRHILALSGGKDPSALADCSSIRHQIRLRCYAVFVATRHRLFSAMS